MTGPAALYVIREARPAEYDAVGVGIVSVTPSPVVDRAVPESLR